MQKKRFTLSLLIGAAACALILFIAIPRTRAGTPVPQPQASLAKPAPAVPPQAYQGMITDTRCGAKHSAAIGMTAADCARVCVHGGEQFALIDGETVYVLEGEPAALKHVAGQRVRIVGTLTGKRISVESVAAL
jgi:hypothetical protein